VIGEIVRRAIAIPEALPHDLSQDRHLGNESLGLEQVPWLIGAIVRRFHGECVQRRLVGDVFSRRRRRGQQSTHQRLLAETALACPWPLVRLGAEATAPVAYEGENLRRVVVVPRLRIQA
jgi:hypothetical protein